MKQLMIGFASSLILIVNLAGQSTSMTNLSTVERTAAIEEMATRLKASYIIADVADKMAGFLRERIREGTYDNLSDGDQFARRVTQDLRSISHDGHLRVQFHQDPEKVIPVWNEPSGTEKARYRRRNERINYGFVRVEILAGNVGYLRLDEFADPIGGGDIAVAAMRFFANTDALIIDLRANGGGGGMDVLLATYLFGGERVHLSDFYIRERNETLQSWTAPYVPGPTYAGKPVFILAGPSTFSAAESFTYNLQALKRARVVGQKTGGAANPGGFVRASDHLAIFIPNGRPINPVTKTNWEGVGVKPDVEVKIEKALDRAHALALEELLKTPATDPEATEARRKALSFLTASSDK